MKINVNNEKKLIEALDEVQKRSKTRTVEAKDIKAAASRIENALGIPKKHMTGIKAEVDINAQDFPHAYKYSPESTVFDLERTATGWVVTDIRRDKPHARFKEIYLTLTDEAKNALIARFAVVKM